MKRAKVEHRRDRRAAMYSLTSLRARWRRRSPRPRGAHRAEVAAPWASRRAEARPAPGARGSADRRRHAQRGAAAVEFALIAPLMITLVLGIIDFGLYINAAAVVGNAAREGARAASLGASTTDVQDVAGQTIDELPGDTAPSITLACSPTTCDSGATATVTVSYSHHFLTPLPMLTDQNIVRTSEMRVE
jgi:Flp pilus assembly protein TadG